MAQQSVTLPTYDGQPVTIIPRDKRGKPVAKVDGALTWKSSNEAVARVDSCDEGNLACVIKAYSEGTATITVTGDGAMGAQVRPLTWTVAVTVTAPEAYSLDGVLGPQLPDVAALRGTVTLVANVADDTGVSSFKWLIDGAPLGEPIAIPPAVIETPWDTTSVEPGIHVVSGEASDAAGNVGTKSLSVLVGR
jgi:hypothetical protein